MRNFYLLFHFKNKKKKMVFCNQFTVLVLGFLCIGLGVNYNYQSRFQCIGFFLGRGATLPIRMNLTGTPQSALSKSEQPKLAQVQVGAI